MARCANHGLYLRAVFLWAGTGEFMLEAHVHLDRELVRDHHQPRCGRCFVRPQRQNRGPKRPGVVDLHQDFRRTVFAQFGVCDHIFQLMPECVDRRSITRHDSGAVETHRDPGLAGSRSEGQKPHQLGQAQGDDHPIIPMRKAVQQIDRRAAVNRDEVRKWRRTTRQRV